MIRNKKRYISLMLAILMSMSIINIKKVGAEEVKNTVINEVVNENSSIKDSIDIDKIAGFFTGNSNKDGGAAEIVKYNKDNNKFYVINGVESKIHIVSMTGLKKDSYSDLKAEKEISVKAVVENDGFVYGDITSIAINTDRDEIAVSVQEKDYSKEGKIVIIDYDGNLKRVYKSGVQPDMITYTKDGKYVLTANEGEPREGFAGINPEGSVTIVNIDSNEIKTVGFTNDLLDNKVHLRKDLNGNKIDAKYDLEPEYITVNDDSTTAYVSLQENNSIALVDIKNGNIKEVKGLGYKDFSIKENALDAARDNKIEIEPLPLKGLYMPDSITYYNGYIITANEGDATEWGKKENAFENITSFKNYKDKITSLDYKNYKGYNSQKELDDKLAEMKGSSKYDKLEVLNDIDNEGIYVLGGRSFSIWKADNMELVFDSGKDFETIIADRYPNQFNVSNDKTEMDARSTKKGPEPEEVKIGKVGDKTYAFVGIERVGGVMTYDITDINNISFLNYKNTRDFTTAFGGDSAPESIDFIEASISPTGYPLLVVANEVSGTVSILQVKAGFEKELKLFHTNDTHSRVDNFPKMKAYIDNFKGKYLLLDAGDTFHGQSFATLEKGSSIARVLQAMGYTAMAPGNHDFNYGQDRLKALGIEADINVLAANIKKNGKNEFKDGVVEEVNGVKVGILGIATPETAYKTNPLNVIGLDFGNKESIIKDTEKTVEKLKRDGAEVVVALTHLGIDTSSDIKSTDIAKEVNGIDVIIDGHSHSTLDKYEEFNKNNKTKITSTGEYLKNFGEVTIDIDENNKVKSVNVATVNSDSLTEKNNEIEKVINDIKEAQKPILNEVVGNTPIKLDGARELVRSGHTNLGRLITSAMKSEASADIAITNGGGIRDSIDIGDITKDEVIKVLPFGNYIVTKKMKGEDIIAALEHGMVKGAGSFTHFAGIEVEAEKYTDDKGKERYKVKKAKVNGEPLDLKKEYVVATNDFLAAGGDGYTMFSKYKTLNEYSALDEALVKYIKKIGAEGIKAIDKENRLKDYKEENNGGNVTPPTSNSNNSSNNTNSNLPYTGGRSTTSVLILALTLVGAGAVLTSKRKKNQHKI